MVTNLTLEEGEQGLSAIVDPIQSRNVMEKLPGFTVSCLFERARNFAVAGASFGGD
jgi:hypothetical protein